MSYAPRVPAHSTRSGAKRTTPVTLLVLHTSEGGEGLNSAENLAAFISTPRSSTNLASYHYIFDTDDVIPIVPDDYIAYSAGGGNHQGIHACYPGKAAQTLAEWTDSISGAYHEQAAWWLSEKCRQYSIPCRKLSVEEVRAGTKGICGHWDVSLAFNKSDHTDPGIRFPWDKLIARANQLLNPIPNTPLSVGDNVVSCINDGGRYMLYDQFQRKDVTYPGDDLSLIAYLWELEDQGVKFQGHDGTKPRGIPIPFDLTSWQAEDFHKAPVV